MRSKSEISEVFVFPEGIINTDNAPEFESELSVILAENKGRGLVIDATGLSYVSSAGLRVLLKFSKELLKSYGKKIRVINVSREAYEVFSMTGFTEILDVEKPGFAADEQITSLDIPSVDLNDYQLISKDKLVEIYRVDDDIIIKRFDKNIPFDYIVNNKQKTEISLKAGIPVCISFNVVECGGSYGIVYENIKGAKPLIEVMTDHRKDIEKYARDLAFWTKKMNSTDVSHTKLSSAKTAIRMMLSKLEIMGILKSYEIEKLKMVLDNIPESHKYAHTDLTPWNIIIKDDEYLVMDSFMASEGHPIIDLSSMAWHFCMLPQFSPETLSPFTAEECERIWKIFLKTYLATENDTLIAKAEYQIQQFAAVRYLTSAAVLPGYLDNSILNKTKRAALSMADAIEPLCF